MQSISTIGLDIAKSVFQVHGLDAAGQAVLRRQLRRRQSQIGLAHRQRQLAQIIAAFNENIESAKLDFLVVLAGMKRIEI